jgi:hypothetical protein
MAKGRARYKPDLKKRQFLQMVEGSLPKHIIAAMEQIEAQEFRLTQKNEDHYKDEMLRKVHWQDDKPHHLEAVRKIKNDGDNFEAPPEVQPDEKSNGGHSSAGHDSAY